MELESLLSSLPCWRSVLRAEYIIYDFSQVGNPLVCDDAVFTEYDYHIDFLSIHWFHYIRNTAQKKTQCRTQYN